MKGLTGLTTLLFSIMIAGCGGKQQSESDIQAGKKEYYFRQNSALLDLAQSKINFYKDSTQYYIARKDKAKSGAFIDSVQKYTYIYGFIDEHTRPPK
jgi:hypothetical protein